MSIRSVRLAAIAFAAIGLMACASKPAASPATPAPTPAAGADKAAPGACTLCKVEIENRYTFVGLIFDKRDTRANPLPQPLARVQPNSTTTVTVKGRPPFGMAIHEDTGTPPAMAGLKNCRQTATRPGSGADFRYACGN